jgi:hypothetical protein
MQIRGSGWSGFKFGSKLNPFPIHSGPASQLVRPPACTARTWRSKICPRCLFRSPQRLLTATARCSGSRPTHISDEAGISKRPFAGPKRLPVSRPPLRGRSSRPAPSTPYRTGASARSVMGSFPRIRFPGAGEISTHNPLPISDPALRPALPGLLLFGTFRSLRFDACPGSPAGSLPPRNARFPSLPGCDGF